MQHLTKALELGGGQDVSLLIKLVEASGRMRRQAEAAAHAQKALGLLGGLADAAARGYGNVASTDLPGNITTHWFSIRKGPDDFRTRARPG